MYPHSKSVPGMRRNLVTEPYGVCAFVCHSLLRWMSLRMLLADLLLTALWSKYPASDKFLNVAASELLLLEADATNDRDTAGCLLLLSTMADDDARLGIDTCNEDGCVKTMSD